jgi:hypothetical protein
VSPRPDASGIGAMQIICIARLSYRVRMCGLGGGGIRTSLPVVRLQEELDHISLSPTSSTKMFALSGAAHPLSLNFLLSLPYELLKGWYTWKHFQGSLYFLLITPWCRILFEKLIVTQLVKKYPAYGTRRFITVFTKAHHWTLS